MPTTQERLNKVIAELLMVPIEDIKPDSTFVSLGADSLDHVELVMYVEDEFDVEIPDEEAEQITTPAKAMEWLTKHGVAA